MQQNQFDYEINIYMKFFKFDTEELVNSYASFYSPDHIHRCIALMVPQDKKNRTTYA